MTKQTIKAQLIEFVRNQNKALGRPLTRREIAAEYERITGKTGHHNLSMALCYALPNGRGLWGRSSYNAYAQDSEGYLCRDTGYGRIKAVGRNQYVAD